jgi:hypothetical protein
MTGDEWRRSITDGIIGVTGYCPSYRSNPPVIRGTRYEITIAKGLKGSNIYTILVESAQEVQPLVNIGHLQRLDIHDWKTQKTARDKALEHCSGQKWQRLSKYYKIRENHWRKYQIQFLKIISGI